LSLPNAAAKIWTVLNYGITFYACFYITKGSNYDAWLWPPIFTTCNNLLP
jgi:hypothetical protein